MFEQFADRGIVAVLIAQEEARLMQHDIVGMEHLLLGLIGEQGHAARVLTSENFDMAKARAVVLMLLGPGSAELKKQSPQQFTEDAKMVLQLAIEEAKSFQHTQVLPPHILLALLRHQDENVLKLFDAAGLTVEGIRHSVLQRSHAETTALEPVPVLSSMEKKPAPWNTCPYCSSVVKLLAIVCRFCQRDLTPDVQECRHCKMVIDAAAVICNWCTKNPTDPYKECSSCKQYIRTAAVLCRYCHSAVAAG